MANTDNPNGFRPSRNAGTIEPKINPYLVASSQVIAAGDAVILDSDNFLQIAVATSGSLAGVAATPTPTGGAVTTPLVKSEILVYDDPTQVFEGQCSGSYTDTTDGQGFQCDIEGTTGIMELNENATTETVLQVLRKNRESENGANARLEFKISKHQLGTSFDQTA